MSIDNVTEIGSPFTVYKTSWGSYYVNRNNKPMRCFFKDGQELDVSKWSVIINDNGVYRHINQKIDYIGGKNAVSG